MGNDVTAGLQCGILPAVLLLAAAGACAPPDGRGAESGGQSADRDPPVWGTLTGAPPRIIAGAETGGEVAAQTLPAFERAIQQGAEVLAPVLTMSADGVLMVLPERHLSAATDIAEHPEFADRRRVWHGHDDWWAEDFSAAELRRLRIAGDGVMASFEEVLDLATAREVRTQPDIAAPAQLREAGLDPLPELVRILRERGLDRIGAPIAIQSADPLFLSRLDAQVDTPLVVRVFAMHKIDPDADPLQPSVSLEDLAAYAEGVAPVSSLLVGPDGQETGFLARARERRLQVYPWPAQAAGGEADVRRLLEWGVDGVFAGSPARARQVREAVAGE